MQVLRAETTALENNTIIPKYNLGED
jgi:hypothetical protein